MTTPTLPPTPSTIANLPLATTPLSGNEFVPISQGGVTKAVAANGFTVVGPAGPAGATGPTGPQGPPGGSANIANGTVNDLAYYTTTTGLGALATADNGILVTNGTGVPSIATAIPNGVTATTQSAANSSTLIATTAFVNQGGLTLGTSTATTQSSGDNSTKVATTAFVTAASAFSGLGSGTNTTATMIVGTGASLAASGSGTIAATSCTGNASTVTTNANLTGDVTSVGNATTVAKIAGVAVGTPTGTTNVVFSNSPTLVTPALGTPSSGNLSNCTNIPVALMTALAVGSLINAAQGGGGTMAWSAGATFAAAVLTAYNSTISGGAVITGDSLSGTWKALSSSGSVGVTSVLAQYQRIA